MGFDFNVDISGGKSFGEEFVKNVYLNRVRAKKPVNTFLGGWSGEGKTWAVCRKAEILADEQGLDKNIIAEKCMIYTPFEYASKYKWILNKRKSGKYNILVMMEARELVNAKDWQTIINRIISDTNALSRAIKRIMLFVISQDIGDVDKGVRKTINYYGECRRPYDGATRIKFWKLRRGGFIENPRLYQRQFTGLSRNNNEYETIKVNTLIMKKPSKDFRNLVDEIDLQKKKEILFPKLEELDRKLKRSLPKSTKLERIAEIISKEHKLTSLVVSRNKAGVIKLKKYIPQIYSLTKKETKELEKLIYDKLRNKGIIKNEVGREQVDIRE